jgi:hypothetical protein
VTSTSRNINRHLKNNCMNGLYGSVVYGFDWPAGAPGPDEMTDPLADSDEPRQPGNPPSDGPAAAGELPPAGRGLESTAGDLTCSVDGDGACSSASLAGLDGGGTAGGGLSPLEAVKRLLWPQSNEGVPPPPPPPLPPPPPPPPPPPQTSVLRAATAIAGSTAEGITGEGISVAAQTAAPTTATAAPAATGESKLDSWRRHRRGPAPDGRTALGAFERQSSGAAAVHPVSAPQDTGSVAAASTDGKTLVGGTVGSAAGCAWRERLQGQTCLGLTSAPSTSEGQCAAACCRLQPCTVWLWRPPQVGADGLLVPAAWARRGRGVQSVSRQCITVHCVSRRQDLAVVNEEFRRQGSPVPVLNLLRKVLPRMFRPSHC